MFYTLLLRDFVEIIIISSCIFTFCTWLKTDKTKNILGYFLAYSCMVLCAWIIQLPTITLFLFSYAPVILLLFIVLHEKTLQRNLVTLCSIAPARSNSHDWLDTIISSCLATINNNKSITIVIENKDALDHFLQAPFELNANISKPVFDLLLSSTSYDEHKMIWVNTSGQIRGINVEWIMHREKKEDTIFYTLQSDALVLNAHPLSRTFSITIRGKETSNITAHQLHGLIKKQLSWSPSLPKGAYRESITSEKSLSR